jgi:hypothetical protein
LYSQDFQDTLYFRSGYILKLGCSIVNNSEKELQCYVDDPSGNNALLSFNKNQMVAYKYSGVSITIADEKDKFRKKHIRRGFCIGFGVVGGLSTFGFMIYSSIQSMTLSWN